MTERKPKHGEYWVVRIRDDKKEIVEVYAFGTYGLKVFPCGDEQGWLGSDVTEWVRKVRP